MTTSSNSTKRTSFVGLILLSQLLCNICYLRPNEKSVFVTHAFRTRSLNKVNVSVNAPKFALYLKDVQNTSRHYQHRHHKNVLFQSLDTSSENISKAPVLNGKMIFPLKASMAGLKGHKVASVYAVLNSGYKRGKSDGWENCEYAGVTLDLHSSLKSLHEIHGKKSVAHVRALSFLYPQRLAMEETAAKWRQLANAANDNTASNHRNNWDEIVKDDLVGFPMDSNAYDYDDDDDDDDEFDDGFSPMDVMSNNNISEDSDDGVVSPFATSSSQTATTNDDDDSSVATDGSSSSNDEDLSAFNIKNVDRVLEEVRPYLISDGGNVSVKRVDEETMNVYLTLEGACGSCPSSTVTMKMGIERVLKENFPNLNEVLQVDNADETNGEIPTELTMGAVREEVNRLKPAVSAMGGVLEIVGVDPEFGVVELTFRGSNKVRHGVELAVLDIPFANKVMFVAESNNGDNNNDGGNSMSLLFG